MERKYKGQFNSVEKSVIEIVSWFGALILIIAPFFRDISTTSFHMILGLSLLTIQAIASGLSPLLARGIYFGPFDLVFEPGNEEEDFVKKRLVSLQHLSITS